MRPYDINCFNDKNMELHGYEFNLGKASLNVG